MNSNVDEKKKKKDLALEAYPMFIHDFHAYYLQILNESCLYCLSLKWIHVSWYRQKEGGHWFLAQLVDRRSGHERTCKPPMSNPSYPSLLPLLAPRVFIDAKKGKIFEDFLNIYIFIQK